MIGLTILFVCASRSHLLVLYHDWALKWFGEYLMQSAERYRGTEFQLCDVYQSCNTTGADQILIDHLEPLPVVEHFHKNDCLWTLWSEQMTRNTTLAQFYRSRHEWPRVGYVHYSDANMRIMRSLCTDCRMQLVPFAPLQRLVRHYWNARKRHDVCFVGTLSDRRLAMNEAVGRPLTKITLFGDQRDMAIAECRVMLNTHYEDDYMIFESLRVAWVLAMGVLVVSETSESERLTALTSHTIFFENRNDLGGVIDHTLAQYSTLRDSLVHFLETRYENTCSVALKETFLKVNLTK